MSVSLFPLLTISYSIGSAGSVCSLFFRSCSVYRSRFRRRWFLSFRCCRLVIFWRMRKLPVWQQRNMQSVPSANKQDIMSSSRTHIPAILYKIHTGRFDLGLVGAGLSLSSISSGDRGLLSSGGGSALGWGSMSSTESFSGNVE